MRTPDPLGADLARGLDPVALARAVGLAPVGWQRDFLRSGAPRVALNCCRQAGKSTMTAVLAVHAALYLPGSLVLILAPAERQSIETFRKVAAYWRALDSPIGALAENQSAIELANGSRVIALTGSESLRGYTAARLLVVDEAARVEDALYHAAAAMVAPTGGRVIAMSTPAGRIGWWWEAWESGRWERFEVPAGEVTPWLTPEFLAERRAEMGAAYYAQEYECRFIAAETAAFDPSLIDAAIDPEVTPWNDLIPASL